MRKNKRKPTRKPAPLKSLLALLATMESIKEKFPRIRELFHDEVEFD
jgi:hypothetical protein